MGFGWSFYGFFLVAVLWITAYFVWAVAADTRDRRGSRR